MHAEDGFPKQLRQSSRTEVGFHEPFHLPIHSKVLSSPSHQLWKSSIKKCVRFGDHGDLRSWICSGQSTTSFGDMAVPRPMTADGTTYVNLVRYDPSWHLIQPVYFGIEDLIVGRTAPCVCASPLYRYGFRSVRVAARRAIFSW
jgi:hypothetical protein